MEKKERKKKDGRPKKIRLRSFGNETDEDRGAHRKRKQGAY